MIALQVEGMSCGHCVGTVTRAVQQIDAGAQVEIDLAKGTVRIESSAEQSALVHAIVEAGYPVSGQSAG